jgi:hypothetical protein
MMLLDVTPPLSPLRRPCDHEYVVYVYDVTSVKVSRDATLTRLLPALKHFMLKITTDPHIFAHANLESTDDRYSKLKIYISELILGSYEYKLLAYVSMQCMI